MKKKIKHSFLLFIFTSFAMPFFAQDNNFENTVRESVRHQMEKYPQSTLKDLYKHFFQDRYGPGHIINDTVAAGKYLLRELDSYTTITGEIAEPTGWQHNFYRVNLSVIKDKLIPYDVFLSAFVRSVSGIRPIPIEDWKQEWGEIEDIIKSMGLSLPDYEKDNEEIDAKLEKGNYVGHHSDIFNKAYSPHYRIVSSQIYEEELLPLLEKQKGNQ